MAVGSLPGVHNFEPAHHHWTAAQQGVDPHTNGSGTTLKIHGNQQSVRIVNFGLIGSDPFPRSRKLLSFNFKPEGVDREIVHLCAFRVDLNVCDNLATRFPVTTHPTAIAQLFVANGKTGTKTHSGKLSRSNDR